MIHPCLCTLTNHECVQVIVDLRSCRQDLRKNLRWEINISNWSNTEDISGISTCFKLFSYLNSWKFYNRLMNLQILLTVLALGINEHIQLANTHIMQCSILKVYVPITIGFTHWNGDVYIRWNHIFVPLPLKNLVLWNIAHKRYKHKWCELLKGVVYHSK